MNTTITPFVPSGCVAAISSKSAAHRILICAAFAENETVIRCDKTNKDIEATASCLCALGAKITYTPPFFHVVPIKDPVTDAVLDCNESGSTLRFLLPIIPAIGVNASFDLSGRLPERPLSPLYEELTAHGVRLSPQGSNPLTSEGSLSGDEYRIRGDISSQFISGLLFALTFSGKGGRLVIEGKMESAPYVDMTVDALKLFGAEPEKTDYGYRISADARLLSPEGILTVEGDWSNAAFPLCMGAIGKGSVTVSGLDPNSHQGDRAVVDILRRFGADVTSCENSVTVKGGNSLYGINIDATQIPDLVPVLATVASVAEGQTFIGGAARLRLKESDRLDTVCQMLTALGANIEQTDDGLIITGKRNLDGGCVQSFNDHRIAMSAAVAAVACISHVCVLESECTSKSYPDFWADMKNGLGLKCLTE